MNGQDGVARLAPFSGRGGVGPVPLPPTGLTASTVSTSQINLSWTASTGATNYIVLRSTTSGGPYAQVASSVTSSSYSDTGLTASTTFYYVVQAAEAGGQSEISPKASVTKQDPSVCVPIFPIFVTVAQRATEQFSDT